MSITSKMPFWLVVAGCFCLTACGQYRHVRAPGGFHRVDPGTALLKPHLRTPLEPTPVSANAQLANAQLASSRPHGTDTTGGASSGSTSAPRTTIALPRRPLGETKVRLEAFMEEVELESLDVEFEAAPDLTLRNSERERFGFRASFGSSAVGGFVQLFAEEYRAPSLLLTNFDNVGFGGGVVGAPRVGQAGRLEFLVPFKAEVDLAAGIEEVAGFDLEFVYVEVQVEAGFGMRIAGVQPAVGLLVHNMVGLFESDNPTSPSHLDPSTITGVNIGGYAEVSYKHDSFPVLARARAIFGEVSGAYLSVGVAF